jgi:hypothetical protein
MMSGPSSRLPSLFERAPTIHTLVLVAIRSENQERPCCQGLSVWARLGSNQRPPACEAGVKSHDVV